MNPRGDPILEPVRLSQDVDSDSETLDTVSVTSSDAALDLQPSVTERAGPEGEEPGDGATIVNR